jgi:hypothetical protein
MSCRNWASLICMFAGMGLDEEAAAELEEPALAARSGFTVVVVMAFLDQCVGG